MKSIRNIAIIAHVDHGKTTLIDGMLKQTAVFAAHEHVGELIMDSGDLERERGITITAKNASINYEGVKINIVDTPGHADFGGEVERALRMVDGVLLLVDAAEGPKPQTRFVLRKALALDCVPIVVINKIDRPGADPARALDKTLELFLDLNAHESQLDFPVIYASGIKGTATPDLKQPGKDLKPLFDAIVKHIPASHGDTTKPTQFLVLNLAYDSFKGRIAVGKLVNGILKSGQDVWHITAGQANTKVRIQELLTYRGLVRVSTEGIEAGDIVGVTGIEDALIGDTLADFERPEALPRVSVEKPTLQMLFMVNDSPFSGREGKYCTSRNLKERLEKELETNVSLQITPTGDPDKFLVAGRGELHLSVLLETMRREGFEVAVSKPEVIITTNEKGEKEEPLEQLSIVVPGNYSGTVMEQVGRRKGTLKHLEVLHSGEQEMEFEIPTRGLIGLRTALMTATRGLAIVHHVFERYAPLDPNLKGEMHGSLVSLDSGATTPYAIEKIESRGTLFVGPQVEVYMGMVIGQSSRPEDLDVNPVKAKHLTNVRASSSDFAIQLAPPRELSLENALEYIGEDELVELTPQSIRIRKKCLDPNERRRLKKNAN